MHPLKRCFSGLLRERLHAQVPLLRDRVKKLLKEHGEVSVGKYNIDQIVHGMKGIDGILYFCSSLDAEKGIRFRGKSIPELCSQLPQINGQPCPEALFWLLLTGENPSDTEFKDIKQELTSCPQIPDSTLSLILNNAKIQHPMTMLSMCVLDMQKNSEFYKQYSQSKLSKENFWQPTLDDAFNIIKALPRLAGLIYTTKYNKKAVPLDTDDWAGNFANYLGFHRDDKLTSVVRGSLVVHADHEGGNVSAHTGYLISSALSDPYYAVSGMINGLAGPLHGLANQEVMKCIEAIVKYVEEKGLQIQSRDDPKLQLVVEEFLQNWLRKSVIPGYGHGKLRSIDPRYLHFKDLALKLVPNSKYVIITHVVEGLATKILSKLGKVKNPYPNVDAHSGVLLYSSGIQEYEYYTVFFAMSRALGVLANIVLARATGLNIERPGSLTLEELEKIAEKASSLKTNA